MEAGERPFEPDEETKAFLAGMALAFDQECANYADALQARGIPADTAGFIVTRQCMINAARMAILVARDIQKRRPIRSRFVAAARDHFEAELRLQTKAAEDRMHKLMQGAKVG